MVTPSLLQQHNKSHKTYALQQDFLQKDLGLPGHKENFAGKIGNLFRL